MQADQKQLLESKLIQYPIYPDMFNILGLMFK